MNTEAPDEDNYGSCCACGRADGLKVRNMLHLEYEGPPGFMGWGCVVCHLPARGAIALYCDACAEAHAEPKFICAGTYMADCERQSLADFKRVPFGHNMAMHADDD
jgi:hypothetical protein